MYTKFGNTDPTMSKAGAGLAQTPKLPENYSGSAFSGGLYRSFPPDPPDNTVHRPQYVGGGTDENTQNGSEELRESAISAAAKSPQTFPIAYSADKPEAESGTETKAAALLHDTAEKRVQNCGSDETGRGKGLLSGIKGLLETEDLLLLGLIFLMWDGEISEDILILVLLLLL